MIKVTVVCDACDCSMEKSKSALSAQLVKYSGKKYCKSCAIKINNRNRDPLIKQRMTEAAAKSCRGKTLEEKVGISRAQKLKNDMSIRNSGQNNPNYGGIYSKGFADNPLTGSWTTRFGEMKADELRRNLSTKNSGKNNPMFGKPSPKRAGNGISGYYKHYYFRSLLELSYILYAEDAKIEIESAERRIHRFLYEFDGLSYTYTPDFYLPSDDMYVELKPTSLIRSPRNLAKISAVKNAGKNIIMLTEKDIKKISRDQLLQLINDELVTVDPNKHHFIK